MRHFVAYHSADRMGYTAKEATPFGLYTNKNVSDPIGDVIRIITGSADKPKRYSLTSWFIVSDVSPADHTDFGFTLSGHEGKEFARYQRLDHLPWFAAFLKRMANFSIGLTELRDEAIIDEFRRVAAEAGCPQT